MADLKALYQQAFDAFVRQEYESAIEGYRKTLEADPAFALAHQGLAEAYCRNGDLESAIEAIRKAIEIEPDESLYHTSLSRFYQMQGRIPEAEQESMIASRLQFRRHP
jgi:tetratricopeptide (TPR) repeat protein